MPLTFGAGEDRDIGFGVNIAVSIHIPRLGRCDFSICLQSCNRIIRLCIYKRSKKQIPVLNGAFHSTVIRSYATRQPAIFTCAVLEQAPVIKRSAVVQMEANNNRPGHSVQQQQRCRFTAPQLQFCSRGNRKRKRKKGKVERPVTAAFLLCMEAVVKPVLSGEDVRLFMGY